MPKNPSPEMAALSDLLAATTIALQVLVHSLEQEEIFPPGGYADRLRLLLEAHDISEGTASFLAHFAQATTSLD